MDEFIKTFLLKNSVIMFRGYMANGGMINGNNGAYGGYRSGQMMPPMQNSLHQQCRPLRNLVPIDLPFYDSHQTLLEPMELPYWKSFFKQSERFANWIPTSPLPRFECSMSRPAVLFFQVPAELPDDFPLNCMVRLEEQIVQLPAVIPTNKPNVEPKRPSRPVDITQQCLNVRDASRPLRLLIEWTGDKRVWAVAVYLVSHSFFDHHQNEHVTRDVIRTRLGGGNDDDIAMAQLKISLLCPLSRKRITLPARCKKCPHLQCFDLYNYLQMNEKRATWRCPVCSDWAPYRLLIIDAYFQDVLSNVDAGAVEVELLVDGSYRTVKSECIDVDSDDTDEKPCTNSGIASGSGTGQAVERAIRASMVDSSTTRSGNPPVSPTPRSRDSSIIILDDDSPPRPPHPAAPAPSNNVSFFPVFHFVIHYW
ncbi:unnamed protein product [Haemonchus placei]|uniref:SP-RING-type domain-containing protein n=1 Tax=Haemonchus placei TaxID=6290 RepID=A0A0N4WC81_HAEPC|nr:unnamed protein product [Haemonchus placei]